MVDDAARVQQLTQQVASLQQQLAAEMHQNKCLQSKLARMSRDTSQSDSGGIEATQTSSRASSRHATDKADLENALEAEQEYIMHKLQKQLNSLLQDKRTLQKEKQQLKSTVNRLNASVIKLSQEKVDLEQSLEMEEEAFINSLFRHLSGVVRRRGTMDQAMQKHGIKVTQVAAASPRIVLSRASATSQDALSAGSTPSHSVRHSLSSATSNPPSQARATTRHDPSLGSSPGASLHATRERLEAMGLSRVCTGEAGGDGKKRRSSARHATVRSEDSMSSLGSMMSAMSRDPSVSRDSAAGTSQGLLFPVSGISDCGRMPK